MTDKEETKEIVKVKAEPLNERQERFCQLYTSADKEFFGNGVQSYLEVYNIDKSKQKWYQTACQACYQLLSNLKVCNRINELLEEGGLNNSFVDKQLLFLITQHSELNSKMKAISEYNKLKKRTDGEDKKDTSIVFIVERPSTNGDKGSPIS